MDIGSTRRPAGGPVPLWATWAGLFISISLLYNNKSRRGSNWWIIKVAVGIISISIFLLPPVHLMTTVSENRSMSTGGFIVRGREHILRLKMDINLRKTRKVMVLSVYPSTSKMHLFLLSDETLDAAQCWRESQCNENQPETIKVRVEIAALGISVNTNRGCWELKSYSIFPHAQLPQLRISSSTLWVLRFLLWTLGMSSACLSLVLLPARQHVPIKDELSKVFTGRVHPQSYLLYMWRSLCGVPLYYLPPLLRLFPLFNKCTLPVDANFVT